MNKIFAPLYIIIIILLIYSAFVSGFNYTFNSDEIAHSQVSYLISKGYQPYKDFLFVFHPLFHLTILPIYKLLGPNLDAIVLTRLLMIFLFSIRIVFSFSLVRIIFGKTASLFFLPLLLLEPITIFSSMQIRPDNLGLVLLPLGLLLFIRGNQNFSKKTLFAAGIILFLALFTSMKLFLTIGTIFLFALFNIKRLYPLFIGFFLGIITYSLLFIINGSFSEMFTNTFVYVKTMTHDSILFPPRTGEVLFPNNYYIYGLPGKPAIWMFLWFLPLLAGAGVFSVVNNLLNKKEKYSIIKIIFITSLILEFLSLLLIRAVFSQYYVLLNWFYVIFASVSLGEIFDKLKETKLKKISVIAAFILLIIISKSAISANFARSKLSFTENINALSKRFAQIPLNEYVFPNLLFHPPAYPLITGLFIGDVPKSILDTFPPLEKALEDKKVPYLILIDYDFKYLNQSTINYIKNNYLPSPSDPTLWKRK